MENYNELKQKLFDLKAAGKVEEADVVRNKIKELVKFNIKEYYKTLKPFKNSYDIPDIPNPVEQFHIDKLIECGAIPKKDLIVGEYYYGKCRNSNIAMWDGVQFIYLRYKWGSHYNDKINHFEDDNGFDLFVPIKRVKPKDDEKILNY